MSVKTMPIKTMSIKTISIKTMSIKTMSIKTVITERKDAFEVEISFSSPIDISIIEEAIDEYNYLIADFNLTYRLFQNRSCIETQKSWQELKPDVEESIKDDDENFRIQIELNKNSKDEFVIINPRAFINDLPKSPEELIKYWNNVFISYQTLYIFNDGFKRYSLIHSEPLKTKELFNDLEISNSVSITPEHIFNLSQKVKAIEQLHSHLLTVLSYFSLLLFCSKYRETQDIRFIFEGYNSCVIDNPDQNSLVTTSDTLFTIYQWVFSDLNISSKLGILRNLISLSNARALEDCFSHNLLKSLFSNYQVYMKENVKQYFEIKNKVTEFMFDLLNKSFDISDQYKVASRNTALAVLSYFFTVVVIKAINKQKLDVLFTPEISSISIVFIVSAIIYVCMVHSDLIKKNKSIKSRISELRVRYEHVLCKEEIEELFNSESLTTSLNDNSSTKYHVYVIGVLVTLLSCVILFSAFNLGLKFLLPC